MTISLLAGGSALSATETVLLGAVAGFTIFLGLPFGRLRLSTWARAFLNAIATGILLFLLWDVLTHVVEPIEGSLEGAVEEGEGWGTFALRAGVFGACLAAGLLSLAYYDSWLSARRRKLSRGPGTASVAEFEAATAPGLTEAQWLAVFIAAGIGLHNFSEGLAIGQSAAAGEIGLALALIMGFALHNATEGFGIVAPLAAERSKPSWAFLFALGLLGGGPTFLGTIVGRSWVNEEVSIAFLALAAGSILYVIVELIRVGTRIAAKQALLWGILLGLMAGLATDWVIEAAEEGGAGAAATSEVVAHDYTLTLPAAGLAPGRVRLVFENAGASTHELAVFKTDLAADGLPMAGSAVDEDDPRLRLVGEVEDVKPGRSGRVSLDLDAGHYVLICNVPGHYQLGMRADLTVE
jgi:ZIP family zinc transporter